MADNRWLIIGLRMLPGAMAPFVPTAQHEHLKMEIYQSQSPNQRLADIALVPSLSDWTRCQLHGSDGAGNGNCISIYDGWSASYPTTIAKNADGTARQTLSIEFWMKSNSPANYPRILQHNDGGDAGFGSVHTPTVTAGFLP